MHRGYIKLWRMSVDSKDYFAEPFTRWQAWADLLLLANHKPNCVYVRGIQVDLLPGDVLAAEEFLSKRWKWSRGKVRNFISRLSSKSVQQITVKRDNKIGVISIVNWEIYQENSTTESEETVQQKANRKPTESQQKDIPKHYKNNKNDKEVILLPEQVRSCEWYSRFLNEYPDFSAFDLEAACDWIGQWNEGHPRKKRDVNKAFLSNWAKRNNGGTNGRTGHSAQGTPGRGQVGAGVRADTNGSVGKVPGRKIFEPIREED